MNYTFKEFYDQLDEGFFRNLASGALIGASLLGGVNAVDAAPKKYSKPAITQTVKQKKSDYGSFTATKVDSTPENIIAATIWDEARGEGRAGRMAVASVIYKRAKIGGWWGNTLTDVCTKSKQFSGWNDGEIHINLDSKRNLYIWRECKQIAKSMLDGTFRPTINATHFYNPNSADKQSWFNKMYNVKFIGKHKFGLVRK